MPDNKCKICGREFYVKPFHAKKGWGKYCSIKCRTKAQFKGKWVECAYCGKKIWRMPKDFKRSKRNIFFCCVACHCSWENRNVRYGVNAPNWISGETAYRDLMRRYNIPYKCARCGISDKRVLVVHHKDGDRRHNKIENLERICCNCHAILHA
jgi:hypothetical protein